MGICSLSRSRTSVSSRLRKQRKILAGLALGVWFFALSVGISHACGWGESGPTRTPAIASCANEHSSDAGTPAGCEEFCNTDMPVVTTLPAFGDRPDTQPLIVAIGSVQVDRGFPPAFRPTYAEHSYSDVPAFLRFTHLRL